MSCKQGAELMGKHGVNVPKGVAVSSVGEVKKAIQEVFPNEREVSSKCVIFPCLICRAYVVLFV